jgi:hypothetical protein
MQIEFPFVREKANIVKSILRPLARVVFNEEVPNGCMLTREPMLPCFQGPWGSSWDSRSIRGRNKRSQRFNSRIPIVVRRVSMKIGDKEFEARVAWSLTEDVPLVLGRLDVFNKFDILFKEREEKVVFIS